MIFLLLCSIPVFSQVKYTSTGYFGIGTTAPNAELEVYGSDPIFEISNTTEGDASICFYDVQAATYQNAKIQFDCSTGDFNFGTYGKDMLRICSEYSVSGKVLIDDAGYNDMITIRPYIHWQGNLGTSNIRWGTVYGSHIVATLLEEDSDSTLKENIRPIENSLDKILSLRGVQYDLKPEFFSRMPQEDIAAAIEEGKNSLGLIAQEVNKVLPEIVNQKSDSSTLTISYTRIVPVLIEAIKEQQVMIESLNNDMSVLKSLNEEMLKSISIKSFENPIEFSSQPTLSQNVPNPFSEKTIIRYSAPNIDSRGMINIYDLQGKQISSYSILNPGEGEIEIPGSSLTAGIYIYNLILDGQVIDSKQMVLTQ